MLTLITLAAALSAAAGTASSNAELLRGIPATIQVDASGRISNVAWANPELISETLSAVLLPSIQAVQFEPALKNGVPATSEMGVSVIVRTQSHDDGTAQLQFVTLEKTVAAYKHAPSLFYPDSMQKAGVSAHVLLRTEVSADGKAIPSSITLVGAPEKRDARKINAFFASAKRALMSATFTMMEKVDGIAVGGTVHVPFVFCMESCDAINAKVAKLRAEQVFEPLPDSGIRFASIKGTNHQGATDSDSDSDAVGSSL